ncbi:MAG: glycoside hydrolase family 2 sugar binding protein, partial [Capsulimonas sp.]|nr:glycoside hydrolase family 2 sugar binding protein [Capsulimonas sp.]
YGGVGMLTPGHMWPVENNAYEMQPSVDALTKRFERAQSELLPLVTQKGLGGAIYTQTTDVEHEVNGFLTYDRKVEKMDFQRVKAANEAIYHAADAIANEPTPPIEVNFDFPLRGGKWVLIRIAPPPQFWGTGFRRVAFSGPPELGRRGYPYQHPHELGRRGHPKSGPSWARQHPPR